MHVTRCRRFEAALPALLLAIAGASARADVVKGPEPCVPAGRVASLTGPAATTRARVAHELGCGEDVCSGDSVSTGAGASLGLLTGGMLIQLGEQSAAKVVLTAEGTPQVAVERGRVRVIDPREGRPPGRVSVLESHAEISGNDTEAELVGEGPERSARFCEFAAPLHLNGGTLAPGTCALAHPGSALVATAAPTSGPSLAALDAACAPAPPLRRAPRWPTSSRFPPSARGRRTSLRCPDRSMPRCAAPATSRARAAPAATPSSSSRPRPIRSRAGADRDGARARRRIPIRHR